MIFTIGMYLQTPVGPFGGEKEQFQVNKPIIFEFLIIFNVSILQFRYF